MPLGGLRSRGLKYDPGSGIWLPMASPTVARARPADAQPTELGLHSHSAATLQQLHGRHLTFDDFSVSSEPTFLCVRSSVYTPAPGNFVPPLLGPVYGAAEEISAPGKMYCAPIDTGSLWNGMWFIC